MDSPSSVCIGHWGRFYPKNGGTQNQLRTVWLEIVLWSFSSDPRTYSPGAIPSLFFGGPGGFRELMEIEYILDN